MAYGPQKAPVYSKTLRDVDVYTLKEKRRRKYYIFLTVRRGYTQQPQSGLTGIRYLRNSFFFVNKTITRGPIANECRFELSCNFGVVGDTEYLEQQRDKEKSSQKSNAHRET